MSKILAFAGSTRTQSWNGKLIRVAVDSLHRHGIEARLIDLREFPMPLYDGDLEAGQGVPEPARALKRLMVAHDGFLIACPEYNSSITAVLKNAIDWVSRPQKEDSTSAFRGKVVSLLAASPGNLGGIRGLFTVRQILSVLGCIVLPTQFGLARAHEAFDDNGRLVEPTHQKAVDAVVSELGNVASRLHAEDSRQ
ncbi:MAG: NAD(P)H-dependent oxidoreductase [Burkholderiales bacterium]|nr:NAD(P)H-dependent oxidoreductase [Burkholderiales bacterium]